jgi:hypothetical protein
MRRMNPSYIMGNDRMLAEICIHKPTTAKFLDKCKWQTKFKADIKGSLVWYMDRSKTNRIGTGV